jgi:hypothetical protein
MSKTDETLGALGVQVHKQGTRRLAALWVRNDADKGVTLDFDGDQILKLKKDQLVEILMQEDLENVDFLITINQLDETLILVGRCNGFNLFDHDVERLKAAKKEFGWGWSNLCWSGMEICFGEDVPEALNETNIGEIS